MTDRSILRWCIGAGLVFSVSCFDGRDALGLPCEQDFQCGNGQVCADGTCAWPGDATGGGADSGTADPTPTCNEDRGVLVREIVVAGSGNPMSVGVGRFSDDSDADVVVLTRSPGRLSVFRFEERAFRLVEGRNVDDQPMDIAVGSLDDDAFDDVVVVDGSALNPSAVTVYWGSADGLFSEGPTSYDEPLPFPHSVDIGRMLDVDAPQFLVSSGGVDNVSSLFTVTDREPMLRFSRTAVSASPWDTVLVELNGAPPLEALVAGSNDDGLDDFPGSDIVHVFGANSGGIFPLEALSAAHSPFGVDAGDLDGDEILEVVVVGKNIPMPAATSEKSDSPSQISICSRDDPGDLLECDTWEPGPMHTGYNNIRLADLDCDGDLDAVIGTTGGTVSGDGKLLVAWGPLTEGFVPLPLVGDGGTGPIGNKIAIADVTGDGAPDVVVPLFGADVGGQGIVRVYSFEEPE